MTSDVEAVFRSPVGDLEGRTFVVTGEERPDRDDTMLLGVRAKLGSLAVISSSRPGSYSTAWRVVPASHSLERVASQRLGERVRGDTGTTGFFRWGRGSRRPRMQLFTYLVIAIILTTLISAIPGVQFQYLWVPTLLIWALFISAVKRGPIIEGQSTYVEGNALRRLRRQETLGGALAIGQVAPPADLVAATRRVDEIKASYGALLSDVIYRVENSALFDPAVEATRGFTLLLARWDERTSAIEPDAVAELAREVELSFETARSHAEALGLTHLPRTARPTARRAIKSLRLAQEATTDGERTAALNRANQLLGSLALYYLPDPAETAAALGGGRPAVEK